MISILKGLQSAASRDEVSGTSYSWDTINSIGRNYGLPELDYEEFSAQYDLDQDLQSIVDNFDHNGITLATQFGMDDEDQEPEEPKTSSIKKMARNALPKEFK